MPTPYSTFSDSLPWDPRKIGMPGISGLLTDNPATDTPGTPYGASSVTTSGPAPAATQTYRGGNPAQPWTIEAPANRDVSGRAGGDFNTDESRSALGVLDQPLPIGRAQPVSSDTPTDVRGASALLGNPARPRVPSPLEAWLAQNPGRGYGEAPTDVLGAERGVQSQDLEEAAKLTHLQNLTAVADRQKREYGAAMKAHAAIVAGEDPTTAYLGAGGSDAQLLSAIRKDRTPSAPQLLTIPDPKGGAPVRGTLDANGNFSRIGPERAPVESELGKLKAERAAALKAGEDTADYDRAIANIHTDPLEKPLSLTEFMMSDTLNKKFASDYGSYRDEHAAQLAKLRGRPISASSPAQPAQFPASFNGKRVRGPDNKYYRVQNGVPVPE